MIVNYLDNIGKSLRALPNIREQAASRVTYYLRAFVNDGVNVLGKLCSVLIKLPSLKKWNFPTLGRLAHFNDVGGKKRYIALGNWMIQGVLKPLHDILMGYIRSLRTDATYDQSKIHR